LDSEASVRLLDRDEGDPVAKIVGVMDARAGRGADGDVKFEAGLPGGVARAET
jgi:hypothetical protein